MPNLITVKIDVTKIDKSRLFKGKKGTYLDLVLIPNKKATQYGDERDEQTHMVCQSITKEERDAGDRGPILGNAKELVGDRDRRLPITQNPAPSKPKDEDDDYNSVPF